MELDKKKEYKRKWYEKNKERLKAEWPSKYQKIREEKLIYAKEYREKNADKIRSWREQNKDLLREINKASKSKNPERVKSNWQDWKSKNKDRISLNKSIRRKRIKDVEKRYSLEQWKVCIKHFDNCCAYCGNRSELQKEHFIPVSKGGEYTVNNIVPACINCNSSKSNTDFFEWYKRQPFYSKIREKSVLKYLNYKSENSQQLALI